MVRQHTKPGCRQNFKRTRNPNFPIHHSSYYNMSSYTCVSYLTLRSYPRINFISDYAYLSYKIFSKLLVFCKNPAIKNLDPRLYPENPPRRLKRCWRREFIFPLEPLKTIFIYTVIILIFSLIITKARNLMS